MVHFYNIGPLAVFSAKLLQSCPNLCDPVDYSSACSSVHGILQARKLEWVAMPSSRRSSLPSLLRLLHWQASSFTTSITWEVHIIPLDVPDGSNGKESACNAGDLDSIPGSGRAPGEGQGNPLKHSRLENPMDRGVWCIQQWNYEPTLNSATWMDLMCIILSKIN